MMAYMFLYYGIAAATVGTITNYLLLGLGNSRKTPGGGGGDTPPARSSACQPYYDKYGSKLGWLGFVDINGLNLDTVVAVVFKMLRAMRTGWRLWTLMKSRELLIVERF